MTSDWNKSKQVMSLTVMLVAGGAVSNETSSRNFKHNG